MTKAQALADFKENILPGIRAREHNGVDKFRRAEQWVNYIDSLCRDKLITEKQAMKWDNPFH